MDLKELVELAELRLKEHGLTDWTFRLGRAKRRLGVCNHRYMRIEISAYYALNNSNESVLDTLLHEIAHAIAGPAAGHGPDWKAVAARLGATPRACDNSPETIVQPGDWQTTCPACNRTHHRYRRPARLTGYRCRCPAHSPLTYAYKGALPQTHEQVTVRGRAANWQAVCPGCKSVHTRVRQPKAGLWRCRCSHIGKLAWQYVTTD
jgi:predicted SprT family Zn-dependent metalloprotease